MNTNLYIHMNMNTADRHGGTYSGYTASIQDFTADRKACLERAVAFAKAERRKQKEDQ